ncbi:sensor histidine kinase [Caldicellulosiruptoraceae bacterium PP1]
MKSFKKIIDFLSSIGIRGKLLISCILIFAIPIGTLGIKSFTNVKETTINEYINNTRTEMKQLNIYLEKNIEMCERISQIVMNDSDFIEFISSNDEISLEEFLDFKEKVLNKMENILYINMDINRLRFYYSNPRLSEVWPILYSEDRLKDKNIIKKVEEANEISVWRVNNVDDIGPPLRKEEKVVSLYKEVKNSAGEHLGILEVNMLYDTFFLGEYEDFPEIKKSSLILLSPDVSIITNNKNFILKGQRISKENFEQKIKGFIKGDNGYFNMSFNKINFIAVYSYIKPLKVYIVKIVFLDELIKKIDKIRFEIIIQIIIIILLVSMAIYWITSTLLKKLDNLILAMRKVKDGDLDVKIDVSGKDEMAEISYHFNEMIHRLNNLINVVIRKELTEKDAQIKTLQNQINAHFIYNVLENIKMLAIIDCNDKIADVVTGLGKLMRYNISWKSNFVYIREEIDNIKNYINLMNIRMENEIKLEININERFLDYKMLKMILQPIVENSIIYGFDGIEREPKIIIDTIVEDNKLIFEVIDNGVGIDEERLEKINKMIFYGDISEDKICKGIGIGLKNVSDRIKLYYGQDMNITIESKPNIYTKVTIPIIIDNK